MWPVRIFQARRHNMDKKMKAKRKRNESAVLERNVWVNETGYCASGLNHWCRRGFCLASHSQGLLLTGRCAFRGHSAQAAVFSPNLPPQWNVSACEAPFKSPEWQMKVGSLKSNNDLVRPRLRVYFTPVLWSPDSPPSQHVRGPNGGMGAIKRSLHYISVFTTHWVHLHANATTQASRNMSR